MFPHPRVRREGAERAGSYTPQFTRESADERDRGVTVSASDSAAVTAVAATGGRLSLVEVVVAEIGGWTSALVCRCHLPLGPFLASDGVVHLDLAVFRDATRERLEQSMPE